MRPEPLAFLHFLAVKSSSGVGDFLGQVSSLLIVTCAAGLIWVVLMALVMQRASDRRRRAQLGLEPLPGLHVSAYQWLKKMANPATPAPASTAKANVKKPAAPEPIPAPDLGMLTGDLAQPELAAMLSQFGIDSPLSTETPVVENVPILISKPPQPDTRYIPTRLQLSGEDDQTPEPSPSDPASLNVPSGGTTPPDSVEVLRVWRDLSDGGLIVEVGKRQFRALSELRSAELERRFLNVMRDLNALAAAPSLPGSKADAASAVQVTPSGGTPGGTPDQQPPDSVEVLRVWRDLSDGGLVVEVGGWQFRALSELRSADLERRFLNVVRDLNALAAAPGRTADAAPADLLAEAPPIPAKPTANDSTPPSLSPGAMFRQMRRVAMGQTPDPIETKPTRSIAEQIEERLQERLADLPDFKKRSIHVTPSLHGGVQIDVDGKTYEGVSEVEDEMVRNLLIDVVREWEESQ